MKAFGYYKFDDYDLAILEKLRNDSTRQREKDYINKVLRFLKILKQTNVNDVTRQQVTWITSIKDMILNRKIEIFYE